MHAEQRLDCLFDHGFGQHDTVTKNNHVVGTVYGELMASVPEWAESDRQVVFLVWETFSYDGPQRHQHWIDFGCLFHLLQREVDVGGGGFSDD